MPYIKKELREKLEPLTSALAEKLDELALSPDGDVDPGLLNFVITDTLVKVRHKIDYRNLNAVLGALSGAHSEYYRRRVAPYEDKKIIANGDVYPDIK